MQDNYFEERRRMLARHQAEAPTSVPTPLHSDQPATAWILTAGAELPKAPLGTPHKIAHDDPGERADEEQINPAKAIVAMDDAGEDQLLPAIGKCLSEQDRGFENVQSMGS